MHLSHFRSCVCVAIIVLVMALAGAVKPLCIAYHRQKMVERDRWFWNGSPRGMKESLMGGALAPGMCAVAISINGEFWDHREQLIAWGAVDSIDYTFEHIEPKTLAWHHVWHRIQSHRCPDYDIEAGVFGSGDTYGWEPAPANRRRARVVISCSPGSRQAWLNFLKSVDVPNYAEEVMTAAEREEAWERQWPRRSVEL